MLQPKQEGSVKISGHLKKKNSKTAKARRAHAGSKFSTKGVSSSIAGLLRVLELIY